MKKIIISCLVAFSILSIGGISLQAATEHVDCTEDSKYSDVKKSDWFCYSANKLLEDGTLSLVNGNTKFNPGGELNRAEALKVLYEASGEMVIDSHGKFFEMPNDWYTKYFYTAYGMKFVTPVAPANVSFNENRVITKAEYIVLIAQIFGLETNVSACGIGPIVMTDWVTEVSDKAISKVEAMKYLCAAKAFGVTKFSEASVPRAEAMEIIYKLKY
ncbi:hypothetical protein COB57_01400 [Candidatus Peregrinibacteria bacterium]|nr:MAG: hypothetical protein COB57_01400 [Candidatus Peregrinibacteria bacterium]